ncbi:MAG: TolC family protein, partial [Desulfuromonas sp.]
AAQEHFDAVTYAYRAGKYTYAQVLDAQQNLFELRLRHIDALGDVHRKHIELERICARLDPHSPAPSPEMTPELASVLDAGDKR